MHSHKRLLLVAQIVILLGSSTLAQLATHDKPTRVDDSLRRDGRCTFGADKDKLSIGGKLCKFYIILDANEDYVTFEVEHSDRFTAFAGTTTFCGRGSNTLMIKRGTEQETAKFVLGEGGNPVYIDIPLNGAETLTLTRQRECPPIKIGDPMLCQGPCNQK